MDLNFYLHVLRKQWRLVAGILLTTVVAAALSSALMQREFRAETQLFVSAHSSADASALMQGGNFTQQRVKSYADIVDSPRVLQPVIDELRLDMDALSLARQVTASAPLDTVLINVAVQHASPEEAASIANAIGRHFIDTVTSLEQPESGEPSPIRVSVIRDAGVPDAPVTPRVAVNLALGLVIGTALGVGIAVLREMLDTTVKSRSPPSAPPPSARRSTRPARTARVPWSSPTPTPPGPRPCARSAPTCSSSTSTTRRGSWCSPRHCRVRARRPPRSTWRSRCRWPACARF